MLLGCDQMNYTLTLYKFQVLQEVDSALIDIKRTLASSYHSTPERPANWLNS